jgi:acetylornithine deacetylase/succinyl-diaminopimelate desuccinylase-like protein
MEDRLNPPLLPSSSSGGLADGPPPSAPHTGGFAVIGWQSRYLLALFLLPVLLLGGGTESLAAPEEGRSSTTIDWAKVEEEAVELFLQYLRIDTTNPPGNEIAAARFLGEICRREGVEYQIFEPAPGRGTIWARLRGDGRQRPLVLLNHLDVVPHSPEFWTIPAFAGRIEGGFIYGRGALDMKSLGIAQFVTLLTLKRAGVSLRRDLIFLGTADEEAGGELGAGWFARTHPELLAGAEYLLNEGGSNFVNSDGRVLTIGISPAEKTPAWLRLTAMGEPGHGSIPRPQSAVNRLVRALHRLLDYQPPYQVAPVVAQSFRSFAPLMERSIGERYLTIEKSLQDPEFRRVLETDAQARALLQNTISLTMLEAGNKVNVIPPVASASIDTRLVPGEQLGRWIAELKTVIADPGISLEPILAFQGNASPIDSSLVTSLHALVTRRFPGAILTFPVVAGFTDSHYFRNLGIHSYGFSPFVAPVSQLGQGYHGNDERIGRKAFTDGVRFLYEVVETLAR